MSSVEHLLEVPSEGFAFAPDSEEEEEEEEDLIPVPEEVDIDNDPGIVPEQEGLCTLSDLDDTEIIVNEEGVFDFEDGLDF